MSWKGYLLDSKVGTSGIGHVQIQNSFRKGHYSLSTGLDVSEWQVLFEEFFAMRIIVKSEAKSDWIFYFIIFVSLTS
jgi:hypothetical protein